jgi:PIN domain nuclease of toxin-antitoxin system
MKRSSARALPPAVLLDTCAVIWLANRAAIADEALAKITHAATAGGVFVSAISAWEIGLLSRAKSGRAVAFLPDPTTWFARLMAAPGIRPAPFTAEIAIAASHLPEPLHGDPADRLLIATARHISMPIVTRDSRILEYAEAGQVAAIAC